ncbi:efflux RND transporter periplasmic adaptor subunit [Sphingomonas sanguinis]|jgi:cobalt-zinc-cadmium efflux system membrane fusion protein|uniref:Efflux RND transporter periplasmic adaptor subunit n=1 Tax=Sphingomonas sanguinis TaxID=33051 RepID=A0A7Y7QWA4_9SPHN|nr:efflux RND transporter periplasmic adaptor subunit [Sphingomonas sanguinis]MBZ6382543.1 efflux RND transporter periplasmic adaptor subunit [Sphingomonas sanguinis]NNG49816.1 efflux RND transporter periplasmic adaptor subunit [Sphingomonas sanguinis]NNG54772.1 efflux RND transporter periplasmic adaptor subunit [Sphingomonas sanguinis]NVP31841.1 efflux RND transporter periplasmic adaptor subunit [Sphingomonas sanguinis]
MHVNPADETLPETRRLSSGQQWRWVGIAAAVVIGVLILITVIGKLTHKEEVPPPPPPPGTLRLSKDQLDAMPTMRVGLGASGDQTMATGAITVDGTRSTPVLMPYAGQVVRVLADAGQVVRQGQPLLLIKTSDFVDARSGLFSARAAYQNAQAQLVAAQRNADRQQQIYETAGGALKDYQQAKADLAAAQATARTAAASLGAARDKLAILGKSQGEINRLEHVGEVSGIHDITTLHAPISGVIASRDVAAGQYVSQGGDKPVMTITDPSRVWLVAQVAESDAENVRVGDPVEVTTPAVPGRVFHATIDLVGAALDPQTHRLPVRASIPNPDKALKPQMFASFAIKHLNAGEAIRVPAAAVIHEGDTARVWIMRPDGLLVARDVQTGDSANGLVTITSGLKPGEKIVTSGALFVNEAGIGE